MRLLRTTASTRPPPPRPRVAVRGTVGRPRGVRLQAGRSDKSEGGDVGEPQVETGGGGDRGDDGGRRRRRRDGQGEDWRAWAYNNWGREDEFSSRGQGDGDGTGDEGPATPPPPPQRGGYAKPNHTRLRQESVADLSLRFGQALSRHPLRARMAVGGVAYALTDLAVGTKHLNRGVSAPPPPPPRQCRCHSVQLSGCA
jgi:hypothetical protein